MLSRHFITSLCISLCSSVTHILFFGGTYVTIIVLFFKSSVLIVTPITSTLSLPYYHEPLLALLFPLYPSCPSSRYYNPPL
ncbi:hypothetical protein E2C01_066254 [Portunus trituberculatus]|uniref:Uncharacterized protein n=1 Tax=Portunus trituberculatus TaxID=210409 RepID=A0A5B7HL11_PORTR|nr:hypothetical protein [Portunus trituberculatus]